MTKSEFFRATASSHSPSYNDSDVGDAGFQRTGDGKIVTRSNNMNSRVNKQLNQLPENLRLNGKTPSGKPRLFVCQICTRAFARQEHLTRHERSHTKEKPYCCGICNRNFSRRDLLLRHAHKIHGGNYGDSIIKRNRSGGGMGSNTNSNKVAKRRQSSSMISPPLIGSNSGLRSRQYAQDQGLKQQKPSLVAARRASFSAQSENYVAPLKNEENHKFDRVKFSTPELLPIDFGVQEEEEEQQQQQQQSQEVEQRELPGNVKDEEDTNMLAAEMPHISLNAPNDFNLLDSVNWINDYNNESLITSGTGTANGSMTGKIETRTNSTDNSPVSRTGSLTYAESASLNGNNIRSSWSIDENDGGLRIKSLFMNNSSTKSPSVNSSKDNSLIPTSSAGNSSTWLQPSSSLPVHNNLKNSPSSFNSGPISDKLSHLQFEDDIGDLTNFTKDVQTIFGRFIQDEETQNFSPQQFQMDNRNNNITVDSNSLDSAAAIGITSDDHSSNNYTFYGLDCLTLSNISRASPPSDPSGADLPTSKIFTPELRQMCILSLKYYNDYCNSSGGSSSGGDPVLISKGLIVPSCNELNSYTSHFQEFFNSHHPSIHPEFFNLDLQSLKKYVHESDAIDEEGDRYLQYSNLACLPLFVATVGSLFKPGCNSKTMELYEISRRVLHVYLERRKQQQQLQKGKRQLRSGQNVWLIQSLTLSIIFALFADYLERIDSEMIKRQVSAVCSIIKNNFLSVISIDLNGQSTTSPGINSQASDKSHFTSSFEYIMFESKIRCTLIVYKFCQFLKIFYHVEGKLFLNEHDLEAVCIPDDERTWNEASLLMPQVPMVKKNNTSFQKFYHSFTFNSSGINPIPESLASIMLYYEFNASTFSTFHVFLTRIDTRKLEMNLPPYQPHLDFKNNDANRYISVLNNDNVILRNCLMSMIFFSKVDLTFGSKIWNGQMKELFDSFLNSRSLNILTKGSYSLLTDFLVALNFSIKNVANILKLDDSCTKINLDSKILSMFNLQAYHNDFLILIKFIVDFEYSPNFKLLCIFTELKKLANCLLIPYFSALYPLEFTKFEDISMTNDFLQHNPISDSTSLYSSINVDRLEKLINNVLVYSFNDASFLNMSDQPINEFPFNDSYPTYYPFTSSGPPVSSSATDSLHTHPQTQIQSSVVTFGEENLNRGTNGNDNLNSGEPIPSKSSIDLLAYSAHNNNSGKKNAINDNKYNDNVNYSRSVPNRQGFAERYRLSEKYIVIAKCFFMNVKESYAHCHILDKMTNDFKDLELCLDSERGRQEFFTTQLNLKHETQDHLDRTLHSSNGSDVNIDIHNKDENSSGDLLNNFLQSEA